VSSWGTSRYPPSERSPACASDPEDPLVRTHKLKTDLADHWAFRVDDDLRVLVRWDGDTCFFLALGTHEVY
jgi:hypothetical protein